MSESKTIEKKAKKPRLRSPNYPAISLGRALELAQKQYDQDMMQKIPVNIAHQRWGYKPFGSQGDLVVAALKAYGLLKVEGTGKQRQVSLTENARKIFLKHPEWDQILKNSALSPNMHREIWEHYNGQIPQDDVLSQYLLWDLRFNDKSIGSFISQFRDTISFANLEKGHILEAKDEGKTGEEEQPELPSEDKPKPQRQKMQQLAESLRELKFLLPSGEAALFLPQQMTDSDFEILEVYLAAHKKASAQTIKDEPEDEPEQD